MSDTNSHFPNHAFGVELDSLPLPADLVHQLNKEAKVSKKTVTELIRQWLEDQSDGREAAKRSKLMKAGKTKAIPAADVYAKLGL
jgi:hypothetical protein